MTSQAPPDREAVVAMLATYRDRSPETVGEKLDSLELAWLVHQVEQRYALVHDVDDESLNRMSTVTGAVEVLGEVLSPNAHG